MLCKFDKLPSFWFLSKLISLQWWERSQLWMNIILSRMSKTSWFAPTSWTGRKWIWHPFPKVSKYKVQVTRYSLQTFHWQTHCLTRKALDRAAVVDSVCRRDILSKNISLWHSATTSWSLCRRSRELGTKLWKHFGAKQSFQRIGVLAPSKTESKDVTELNLLQQQRGLAVDHCSQAESENLLWSKLQNWSDLF